MKKIKEGIKSFQYKIPGNDPALLLYDFYFLVGYGSKDRYTPPKRRDEEISDADENLKALDFALKEAVKDCTDQLAKHMIAAIRWSLSAELNHIERKSNVKSNFSKLSPKTQDFFKAYHYEHEKYRDSDDWLDKLSPDRMKKLIADDEGLQTRVLKKQSGKDGYVSLRDVSYRDGYLAMNSAAKKAHLGNEELADVLADLYENAGWYSSYGGKNWASIAKAWKSLLQADDLTKKIVYIDHAYNLQHNTGSVFTKLLSYYDAQGSTNWLAGALDWKRDTKDIRSFYDKVSGSLKPVVAWIAYNEYGLSMEGYDARPSSTAVSVEEFPTTLPKQAVKKANYEIW